MKKQSYFIFNILIGVLFMLSVSLSYGEINPGKKINPELAKIRAIFDEIGAKLDTIDFQLEIDTDRVQTIVMTILFSHGYTEENSSILITGMKHDLYYEDGTHETIKIIEMITVQIYTDKMMYQLNYIVDQPDLDPDPIPDTKTNKGNNDV